MPRWLDAAAGDLQVRPGRRVHRRAQDAPQHRPRPQRPDHGSRAWRSRRATWSRRWCPTRPRSATTCAGARWWAPGSRASRTAGRARSTCTRCAMRRRRCASIGLQPVAWQTGLQPGGRHGAAGRGRLAGRRRAGHGGVRPRSVPRHPRPRRHPPRHDGDRAGHGDRLSRPRDPTRPHQHRTARYRSAQDHRGSCAGRTTRVHSWPPTNRLRRAPPAPGGLHRPPSRGDAGGRKGSDVTPIRPRRARLARGAAPASWACSCSPPWPRCAGHRRRRRGRKAPPTEPG